MRVCVKKKEREKKRERKMTQSYKKNIHILKRVKDITIKCTRYANFL